MKIEYFDHGDAFPVTLLGWITELPNQPKSELEKLASCGIRISDDKNVVLDERYAILTESIKAAYVRSKKIFNTHVSKMRISRSKGRAYEQYVRHVVTVEDGIFTLRLQSAMRDTQTKNQADMDVRDCLILEGQHGDEAMLMDLFLRTIDQILHRFIQRLGNRLVVTLSAEALHDVEKEMDHFIQAFNMSLMALQLEDIQNVEDEENNAGATVVRDT